MKVSIITRHAVANYGSILQTYATQMIFNKLGCESEIINYIRTDEYDKNIVNTMLKRNSKWNRNIVLRVIYKIIQSPSYLKSFRKFQSFRKEYLNESPKCYNSFEELKQEYPKADFYVSGSDQIWGKIGDDEYDKSYFLDFLSDFESCFSLSSSFGLNEISQELSLKLPVLLKKYSNISVREQNAVDILNSKGINCNLTLDPTLLLNVDEWNEFININKNKYSDYVVVYQLHNNSEIIKVAKRFAKKYNKKLLIMSANSQKNFGNFKYLYLPDPRLFLACIRDSYCVITDSFHASVFSIIFNKQFIVFPPVGTSTRITDLLDKYNLSNKIYNNNLNIELFDYKDVNKSLMIDRKKTIDYITQAINCINKKGD